MAIDTTKKVKKITVDGTEMELAGGSGTNKLKQVTDGSLAEITAEDLAGISTIRAYAFRGVLLERIELPEGVTNIQNYAFSNVSRLTDIILPETLTLIRGNVFEYCSALKHIELPKSLNTIETKAFQNTSLNSVYIKDLSSWINISFADSLSNPCYYGKAPLYLNNEPIIDLVIPDSITEIKQFVFDGVSSLETVTISNNVTKIGNYAFGYCNNLTSITIPESVTNIGSGVFYSCSKLTEMTILATTPPTLANKNAISNATTTIYIPAGTLSAYQSATNWSSHASKFVEIAE